MSSLRKNDDNNAEILSMLSHTEYIEYQVTNNLLEALYLEKKKSAFSKPEYNYKLDFTRDYVYLGIDYFNVPFFRVLNDTTDKKYFYIGPFRNRFFLYDFLDVMNELFGYPVCEDEQYPCDLYKKKLCKGYCLEDRKTVFDIIQNSYLTRNFQILNDIKEEKNKHKYNLNFEKADKLNQYEKIIEKYYGIIDFLCNTKKLNFTFKENGIEFEIKKGLIKKITEKNNSFEFPVNDIEYGENEIMAIEKESLDEAWIVYRYLLKKNLIKQNSLSEQNSEL